MLTVEDAADHYALTPGTIRARIRAGDLRAQRINRHYRLDWEDVWSCEQGPAPKGRRAERYRMPLMTKSRVAAKLRVSVRTIERMIGCGLPTRSIWGAVRINPADARDWLVSHHDIDLRDDWHV